MKAMKRNAFHTCSYSDDDLYCDVDTNNNNTTRLGIRIKSIHAIQICVIEVVSVVAAKGIMSYVVVVVVVIMGGMGNHRRIAR